MQHTYRATCFQLLTYGRKILDHTKRTDVNYFLYHWALCYTCFYLPIYRKRMASHNTRHLMRTEFLNANSKELLLEIIHNFIT